MPLRGAALDGMQDVARMCSALGSRSLGYGTRLGGVVSPRQVEPQLTGRYCEKNELLAVEEVGVRCSDLSLVTLS